MKIYNFRTIFQFFDNFNENFAISIFLNISLIFRENLVKNLHLEEPSKLASFLKSPKINFQKLLEKF